MTETDDLNIGDPVIYQGKELVIVDHYGNGVYAIILDGEWKAVKRSELIIESEVV